MKKLVFILFSLALGAIVFCNIQCGNNTAPQENTTYLNHNDSVKYIGKEQCRACHASIYNTFIETGMGQRVSMWHQEQNRLPIFLKSMWYMIGIKIFTTCLIGSKIAFISWSSGCKAKTPSHKRIERVDYIIGSGQHTNSHFTNINGYVYQLPLTWYAQKAKWDLPPGFENGRNVRFTRAIEFECYELP
jgi:hypothetical protein